MCSKAIGVVVINLTMLHEVWMFEWSAGRPLLAIRKHCMSQPLECLTSFCWATSCQPHAHSKASQGQKGDPHLQPQTLKPYCIHSRTGDLLMVVHACKVLSSVSFLFIMGPFYDFCLCPKNHLADWLFFCRHACPYSSQHSPRICPRIPFGDMSWMVLNNVDRDLGTLYYNYNKEPPKPYSI